MKPILTFAFCLITFAMLGQPVNIRVGTNSNDHTGELLGRNTWLEINFALNYLFWHETNDFALFTQWTNNPPAPNLVKSSFAISEYSSNSFPFTAGSNYLGAFTNIYQFMTVGYNQGTNQILTNNMSTDGGMTWVPFYPTNVYASVIFTNYTTNYFVTNYVVYSSVPGVTNTAGTNFAWLSFLSTNQVITSLVGTNLEPFPIEISTLAGIPATGMVAVVTLSDNSRAGATVGFADQNVSFAGANVTGLTLAGDGQNITNLQGTNIIWPGGEYSLTRYISTNLTLATSATILFSPPFPDTNFGVFEDISSGTPATLVITGKTTNSVSSTMGAFSGTEAFGLIHK